MEGMERKTLKQFHRDLTWQSRIYTTAVVLTILFAHVFQAWDKGWMTTILVVIASVLLLDTFNISFHRHPKAWQLVKWGIILLLLGLLLIGAGNR
jgi:hypothetical protein